MIEKCEECKFWKHIANARRGLNKGECKRFPPLKYFAGEGWSYPMTSNYDWCGEWKKKEE
jgi:hypothetical protein